MSNSCLIISNPSNDYLNYIRINNIKIPKNVLVLTEDHNFINVIKITDVFLRATTTDGDSISINEALYLNKTVIASDCVSRPHDVILYKNKDFFDLEKKIQNSYLTKKNPVKPKSCIQDLLPLYGY